MQSGATIIHNKIILLDKNVGLNWCLCLCVEAPKSLKENDNNTKDKKCYPIYISAVFFSLQLLDYG